MPLTRITVREGMSDARLQQLSDLYHQTLVEVFDVPPEDKFQILAGKPRSTAVKQRLYERLAERLHADLGIHPDNLMVVIQLNGSEEWSFGRGLMFRQEVIL